MLTSRSSSIPVLLALVITAAPGCLLDSSPYETPAGPGGTGASGGSTGTTTSSASGGSAGTTSGGSAGDGGTGGTGGTTPTDPEACDNGADDDKDGKIDCADTEDCGALVTCVSAAPDGWTGYFHIRREAHTGAALTPPDCPDGSKPARFFAGPNHTASCAACSCAWPNTTCSAPRIDCYDNSTDCNNGSDYNVTATTTDCIFVQSLQSCKLTGDAVAQNAELCNASGGEKMDSLLWEEEVFACGGPAVGGGCESGQACTPADTGDYSGLCIERDGTEPCPAGWDDQDIQVYTNAVDQRGCTACACLSPATCNADGGYTVYDNGNCSGSQKSVFSSSCGNVYNQLAIDGSLKPKLATVKNGQCGGGEPTGQLDLTGAKRICCMR